jgi:hypothetical protein
VQMISTAGAQTESWRLSSITACSHCHGAIELGIEKVMQGHENWRTETGFPRGGVSAVLSRIKHIPTETRMQKLNLGWCFGVWRG